MKPDLTQIKIRALQGTLLKKVKAGKPVALYYKGNAEGGEVNFIGMIRSETTWPMPKNN